MRAWIKRGIVLGAAVCVVACGAMGPKRSAGTVGTTSGAPGRVIAQYEHALVAMQDGNDDRATQRLEVFIGQYPQYAGPYVNLGIVYARNDRTEEAEQMFQRAIEVNPGYAAAYNELGILHRQDGRFEEAVSAYRRAIKADSKYTLAYLNLGVLYDLYQRQPQQALEYYERFVALEQDEQVERWIVELQRRIAAGQRSASAGAVE
ncbi:MAG: tetratricopeptide repeat protein [Gammaproteobacteria bacterium]